MRKLSPNEEFDPESKGKYYSTVDQVANSILARILILINRLYEGKDEEYEQKIIYQSLRCLRCPEMNPKHFESAYLPNRKKLCDRLASGDPELLNQVRDLLWLKTSAIREVIPEAQPKLLSGELPKITSLPETIHLTAEERTKAEEILARIHFRSEAERKETMIHPETGKEYTFFLCRANDCSLRVPEGEEFCEKHHKKYVSNSQPASASSNQAQQPGTAETQEPENNEVNQTEQSDEISEIWVEETEAEVVELEPKESEPITEPEETKPGEISSANISVILESESEAEAEESAETIDENQEPETEAQPEATTETTTQPTNQPDSETGDHTPQSGLPVPTVLILFLALIIFSSGFNSRKNSSEPESEIKT